MDEVVLIQFEPRLSLGASLLVSRSVYIKNLVCVCVNYLSIIVNTPTHMLTANQFSNFAQNRGAELMTVSLPT
jgi:hypothetical protein